MTFIAIFNETESGCGGRYTVQADNWNAALKLATEEYGREPDSLTPEVQHGHQGA